MVAKSVSVYRRLMQYEAGESWQSLSYMFVGGRCLRPKLPKDNVFIIATHVHAGIRVTLSQEMLQGHCTN